MCACSDHCEARDCACLGIPKPCHETGRPPVRQFGPGWYNGEVFAPVWATLRCCGFLANQKPKFLSLPVSRLARDCVKFIVMPELLMMMLSILILLYRTKNTTDTDTDPNEGAGANAGAGTDADAGSDTNAEIQT